MAVPLPDWCGGVNVRRAENDSLVIELSAVDDEPVEKDDWAELAKVFEAAAKACALEAQ
jgi:hypothetical protein